MRHNLELIRRAPRRCFVEAIRPRLRLDPHRIICLRRSDEILNFLAHTYLAQGD